MGSSGVTTKDNIFDWEFEFFVCATLATKINNTKVPLTIIMTITYENKNNVIRFRLFKLPRT